MKKYYLFLILLLLGSGIALGQETPRLTFPIQTDRPSRGTNNPYAVPKGYFQMEAGLSYHHFEIDWSKVMFPNAPGDPMLIEAENQKVMKLQLPEFLLKYGITKGLEARIGSGLLHTKTEYPEYSFPLSPETYLNDWIFGLKYQLAEFHNSRGILSVLAESNIPNSRSGKHLIDSEWIIYGCAIGSYSFNKWFRVTTNLGIKAKQNLNKKEFSWALLPSVKASEQLSFFAEWYGEKIPYFDFSQWKEVSKTYHKLNGGLIFQLNKQLQFDLSGGVDLRQDIITNSYFLSTGLSWRTQVWGSN